MARSRSRAARPARAARISRTPRPAAAVGQAPPPTTGDADARGEFTGKYIVLLRDDGVKEGLAAIKAASGLSDVFHAKEFKDGAVEIAEANKAEVFFLDELKVAVVDVDPLQLEGLQTAAADDGAILAVEPERIMYALPEPSAPVGRSLPFEYLRGYQDAVNHLCDSLMGTPKLAEAEALAAALVDTAQFTWGLQATHVNQSRFSGRGIRVAVLDTGFDLNHPDFVGRTVSSQSFIQGQAVDDLNGHGTHCIGTSLGPQLPAGGVRRYGCAYRAEIFAGKVLSNQGSGGDGGILAGINWAITNGCQIISMSLGAATQPGEPFSTIYETVAQRALQSNPGTLIVAAAGNESRDFTTGLRLEPPRPVGRPANCPSILAVGSLDGGLQVSPFSNGGINPTGGGVDIAGPGSAVFSSVPDPFPASVQPSGGGRPWPARYHTISGTSMATPHVAGIAALWLESRGGNTSARALWQLLTGNARRLNLSSRDVGAGLVQAPL